MRTETFFAHRRYRWLWVNLVSVVVLTIAYILSRPEEGASGRSLFGYTVGVLAAVAIVYLMCYGIRRRSYHSSSTTLKGWLSAHVWLGFSLLWIVPLHSGFRLHFNLHGSAYILMAIVVISGIWGALNYKTLAPQIGSHRGGGNLKSLLEQFNSIAANIANACNGKSDRLASLRNQIEVLLPGSLLKLLFSSIKKGPSEMTLADMMAKIPVEEKGDGLIVLQLAEKKRGIAYQIQNEVRILAQLKLWLLIHLPISFALIIAVALHIFVVLIY